MPNISDSNCENNNCENYNTNNENNENNVEQYFSIWSGSDDTRIALIVHDHIKAKFNFDTYSLPHYFPLCKTIMTDIMDSFKHLIWLTDGRDFELDVFKFNESRNCIIDHFILRHFTVFGREVHNVKIYWDNEVQMFEDIILPLPDDQANHICQAN